GIRDLIVTGVQTCALPIFGKKLPRGQPLVLLPIARRQNDREDEQSALSARIEEALDLDLCTERRVEKSLADENQRNVALFEAHRSEERRVGKGCSCGAWRR